MAILVGIQGDKEEIFKCVDFYANISNVGLKSPEDLRKEFINGYLDEYKNDLNSKKDVINDKGSILNEKNYVPHGVYLEDENDVNEVEVSYDKIYVPHGVYLDEDDDCPDEYNIVGEKNYVSHGVYLEDIVCSKKDNNDWGSTDEVSGWSTEDDNTLVSDNDLNSSNEDGWDTGDDSWNTDDDSWNTDDDSWDIDNDKGTEEDNNIAISSNDLSSDDDDILISSNDWDSWESEESDDWSSNDDSWDTDDDSWNTEENYTLEDKNNGDLSLNDSIAHSESIIEDNTVKSKENTSSTNPEIQHTNRVFNKKKEPETRVINKPSSVKPAVEEKEVYSTVRDYVKKHKGCTKSDVLRYFNMRDIKKALMSAKIVERKGKFYTV